MAKTAKRKRGAAKGAFKTLQIPVPTNSLGLFEIFNPIAPAPFIRVISLGVAVKVKRRTDCVGEFAKGREYWYRADGDLSYPEQLRIRAHRVWEVDEVDCDELERWRTGFTKVGSHPIKPLSWIPHTFPALDLVYTLTALGGPSSASNRKRDGESPIARQFTLSLELFDTPIPAARWFRDDTQAWTPFWGPEGPFDVAEGDYVDLVRVRLLSGAKGYPMPGLWEEWTAPFTEQAWTILYGGKRRKRQ